MAEQNINIKADTYIDRYDGGKSFSGDVKMCAYRLTNSSAFQGAFFQVDIPLFDNKEIVSAFFRVHNTKKTRKSTMGLAQYNIPGSIAGLTANMFYDSYLDSDIVWSPTEIAPSATVQINNEWLEWDVTSILKNNTGKSNVVLSVYDIGDVVSDQGSWIFTSMEGGKTPYINVVYNNAVPSAPTVIYPNGDVIEKGTTIIFQWKHNSVYDTGQTKFELGWRLQGEAAWNTVIQSSTEQTYIVDSVSLPLGIIEWRIQTFNVNNASSGYSYGNFELTGKPTSPIITEIKNDAITEITWKSNESESAIYTLRIVKDGRVIHDSGEMAGGISNSYVPNMMIPNGDYIVRIRIGSIYGVWSDESAKAFTISASVPAVPDISLSPASAGVKISTHSAASTKFVFRAEEGGAFEAVARFSGDTYTDYTVRSDMVYKYYIRAYEAGFADSHEATIKIHYAGTLLSEIDDQSDIVTMVKSTEDWYAAFSRTLENESELIQYSGRVYSVKESGIHKEDSINVSFFLMNKDIEKIMKMIDKNGIYIVRNREICWCCDTSGVKTENAFFNRGKNIQMVLTRIDHDLGVRFDE